METLALSNAQNELAEIIARVEKGDEIAIAHNDGDEVVAVIVPFASWKKKSSRKLGSLHDRGPVAFSDPFQMSDSDLLNS